MLEVLGSLEAVYRRHEGIDCNREKSTEEFWDWAGRDARDNLRNLVRGRVERKTDWERHDVDAAFAELCWLSVRFTGASLSAATAVWVDKAKRAGNLSDREVALFRLLYVGHEAFGGLPLFILFGRFEQLEPWLELVLISPDDLQLGHFYTLLQYYAVMARSRRSADAAKRRPPELHGAAAGPALEAAPR